MPPSDPYFATMEYANGEITEDEYSGRLGAWGVMTLAASRLPIAQVANKALAGFTKTFPKTTTALGAAARGTANAIAKSPIGRLATAAAVAGEQGLAKIRQFLCTKNAGQTKVGPAGPAHNAANFAKLSKHLSKLEEYGSAGFKEIQNGRIRYSGNIKPPRTSGKMAGIRRVHEWDPASGATRTWFETVDHAGRVRIVRPETGGPKIHYQFDELGNFTGTF